MPSLIDIVENEASTIGEIKDVPPIPKGHYLCQMVGNHEIIKAKTGTDGVQFTFRLLQPRDDVEQADLKTYLDAAESSLTDVQIKHAIYESPFAKQNLRDLLRALGSDDETSVKQALAEIPGQQCIMTIGQRIVDRRDGTKGLAYEVQGFARAL